MIFIIKRFRYLFYVLNPKLISSTKMEELIFKCFTIHSKWIENYKIRWSIKFSLVWFQVHLLHVTSCDAMKENQSLPIYRGGYLRERKSSAKHEKYLSLKKSSPAACLFVPKSGFFGS